MADRNLVEAFDDCVDRLAAGQTVAECLRAYPAHAVALAAMLEAVNAAQRTLPAAEEVAQAQDRSRLRLERALAAPYRRSRIADRRLASLAAAFALIFVFLLGGAAVAAQSSLPGDPLYGLKRLTEEVRLALSGNDPALQAEFARRRTQETVELLKDHREAELTFEGDVHSVVESVAMVDFLAVRLNADTQGLEALVVGNHVEVRARTTADGDLIALSVRRIGPSQRATPVEPAATPEPGAASTATRPPTATPRPSNTPTRTPAESTAEMQPPEVTPEPRDAGETAEACPAPEGWVRYSVQTGDTLSDLANRSGATLEALMRANCIDNPRLIAAGQPIVLPRSPSPRPQATSSAEPGEDPEIERTPDDDSGEGSDDSGRSGGDDGSENGGEGGDGGGRRGG